MPSANHKTVSITFLSDHLVFVLTGPFPPLGNYCFDFRTKFYLLFTSESLQDFDPIYLKCPLKALLLSVADLGTTVLRCKFVEL